MKLSRLLPPRPKKGGETEEEKIICPRTFSSMLREELGGGHDSFPRKGVEGKFPRRSSLSPTEKKKGGGCPLFSLPSEREGKNHGTLRAQSCLQSSRGGKN